MPNAEPEDLDSPSVENSPHRDDDDSLSALQLQLQVQSLQRRVQELEAENARLSISLSNCVCQKSGTRDKAPVLDCGPRQTAAETTKKSDMEKKVREKKIAKKIEQVPSEFAAIVVDNVKLIYLRKSLLKELLKEPESFEEKVTGCFVRIKSGRNDSFSTNHYHIRQIKGVKTVSVSENQTETALLLSAMPAETSIDSTADGYLSEKECVELKEKIQAGVFEWPTVAELQRKAELLHKDITKNWIAKELPALPDRIDFANTYGRRKEKIELIQRRKMLQTPSEVTRLLETLPKVILGIPELGSNSKDARNDAKTDDKAPESIL